MTSHIQEYRAGTFNEETTPWVVILSRSEGSLGLDVRRVSQEANARLPNNALMSLTLSDPSLRLRMTTHGMRSSSDTSGFNALLQVQSEKVTTPC